MYYDKLSNLGIRLRRRSGQEKTTCPQCSENRRNKKDPCLSVNITEGTYCCHNCDWKGTVKEFYKSEPKKHYKRPEPGMFKHVELSEKILAYFQGRGISQATLNKFLVHGKEEWMPQTQEKERCIVFPYIRNGEIINAKYRDGRKNFKMVKDAELILFGMQTLEGRHCAIIVEGECFHPSAKVLTKNGWVTFEEWSGQDVAQYSENGRINFVSPIAKVEKHFNGDLIEFSNNQKFYSLTTPEHNLVFKHNRKSFVKRKAIEIPSDPKYAIPRVAIHDGCGINLSDNEIRLCIAVSADFTLRETGDLYCCFKKDRKAIRLKNILESLKIPYSCNIDSRKYYSFFIRRGNRPNYVFKEFPHNWIYETSERQKKLIIDEILYWDGNSVPNRNQIEYSTKLKSNATFIQTISTLCGYCSTIISRKNEFGNWFKVSILFSKTETNSQNLRKSQKYIPYNGKVYCLTVPSGMLLVNQNDCISVSGNCDALSFYEAGFGKDYQQEPDENGEVVEHELGRWAILSVPNGASRGNGQLEYLDNCAEELQRIDEFVIAVDNDEAGTALKDALVRRLGVEKCRFLTYPVGEVVQEKEGRKRAVKDANEILQYFGAERLVECVLQAKFVPISGIYFVEDLYESMLANFKKGIQLAPTTRFGEMDEFFRWKKGDINLWTGYANMGKSFFVLQLMLTKSLYDGWKWAIFSPENFPANDFYDDLVEMLTGKWLNQMNEVEYKEACDFINEHIYYIYPEDDHTIENIHEKFRYLILKKGVDGVLVDPFNQLDKNQKAYERDDQYLSRTLKDIKRFALLNAVSYNIIAHPNKPNYKEDRSLPPADMYDLNGGSMWGNKSDQIISYHRPNFHLDKNDSTVEVYMQKIKRKRTGGKHGFFTLRLNWGTKRYSDNFGNVFCDPNLAVKIISSERNDYSQMDIAGNWETNSEMPF